MNFLQNIFGKSPASNPYWVFDPANHFRPKINKGEFYSLTGFELGWLLLEPLSKMVGSEEYEIERGKRLSYGQKALYYWWYLDAQVRNGGFVQFFYNGYGKYLPVIIEGLAYIVDTEMEQLCRKALKVYQKNYKTFLKAGEEDLFGSDLYERMSVLGSYDSIYYDKNEQTMARIEQYVRKHPQEFCVDENGNEYQANFSGECQTFYPNGQVKHSFAVVKGVIEGRFQAYYDTGILQEEAIYKNGAKTLDQAEYYENGNLKIRFVMEGKTYQEELYYENGQISELNNKSITPQPGSIINNYGISKKWYENGQLKEEITYNESHKPIDFSKKYYANGHPKLIAEYTEKGRYLYDFWDEEGNHLLKEGTGICIQEDFSGDPKENYSIEEYQNGLRHGTEKSFRAGKLSYTKEYQNGKEHGYTHAYYTNGRLKSEKLYQNGEKVSEKTYPKFDNPIVIVSITAEMEDQWLINRELNTADTYPVLFSSWADLQADVQHRLNLFDGYTDIYEYELFASFFVHVSESGEYIQHDFLVASNGWVIEIAQNYLPNLKFLPARRNGEAVDSYVVVRFAFNLAEGS